MCLTSVTVNHTNKCFSATQTINYKFRLYKCKPSPSRYCVQNLFLGKVALVATMNWPAKCEHRDCVIELQNVRYFEKFCCIKSIALQRKLFKGIFLIVIHQQIKLMKKNKTCCSFTQLNKHWLKGTSQWKLARVYLTKSSYGTSILSHFSWRLKLLTNSNNSQNIAW